MRQPSRQASAAFWPSCIAVQCAVTNKQKDEEESIVVLLVLFTVDEVTKASKDIAALATQRVGQRLLLLSCVAKLSAFHFSREHGWLTLTQCHYYYSDTPTLRLLRWITTNPHDMITSRNRCTPMITERTTFLPRERYPDPM